MPTRSKLQSQFPSSSHWQQKDSAASSKFHDHSSFTIHAQCFSGTQNSITVLFRLFFKIFQCALFHFYLKNSNLLLYLFSLTVFQNRADTIAIPKCKWPKTVHVAWLCRTHPIFTCINCLIACCSGCLCHQPKSASRRYKPFTHWTNSTEKRLQKAPKAHTVISFTPAFDEGDRESARHLRL